MAKNLAPLGVLSAAVAPVTPTLITGDVYYDTVLASFRTYDGAAWHSYITADTTQTISGNKNFTGTVIFGNKNLWSGTRTLPGATNAVDLGTFTATNGGFQTNIMFSVDGATFNASKTYDFDVQGSIGSASTWYVMLPQDSSASPGGANDITLEVNRNATTNAYTFRIRQTGAAGGTLYFQVEGWGDASLTFTPSTSTTAAPAAVTAIHPSNALYVGPGAVGINTQTITTNAVLEIAGSTYIRKTTSGSGVALTVQSPAPGSGFENVQEWYNSTNALVCYIAYTGQMRLAAELAIAGTISAYNFTGPTITMTGATTLVTSDTASHVALTARCAINPTANIQEWQKTTAAVVAFVDTLGNGMFANTTDGLDWMGGI